ncbi:hypothetical protein BDZ89DRAFT_402222 [Hymenopellis radicata]|nr:hypothetical protein BDZ89DRAFT_402222 [Hymenopellis radicata]
MGQSSHSRLLGMRYRNHSESHLGVQATLIHERNNSFAVPQEAMGTAENAVDLLQYNDFAGTGSALAPTSWPTPPLTLPPALNTGLSSQGEATWDRTVLPVEGISSTYLTAPASHVDMQPYNYSSSSPMYSAEVQHSEGPPPSEPLTDYSSPCNGFGLVGQSSDPRQPNYESLTLPNSQSSLNYDRHTTNPDQDQISFVFRERPPASYVPPSMDVDPPMPVPQVTPPTLPGAADSVAPGLIVSSQCNFPKHTRGERKPDPKALEKMRWKNKVASFFCYLCSPVRSFTIKSARDRHMRDKHSGAPPAACSLCGNPYRDQSSLQRHKRLHHGSNATVGKSRSSKKLVTRN